MVGESTRTRLGLSLLLFIELSSAIVILNEELLDIPESHKYKIRPDKKAGAYTARTLPADAPCRECLSLAKHEYDRFNQYTYLNYYQENPNVTNYDQLAGMKTCRQLANVTACYDRCFVDSSVEDVRVATAQVEYRGLTGINGIYCEERYTPGHASCRLADTHRCDRIRRNSCGEKLEEFTQCVDDILATSGQSCDGDCTPARRFIKSQKFMWEIECLLRATFKSQCKDIVTIFCFEQVKDSDLNYGIYQRMDTITAMASNLTNNCEILSSPFQCLDTATNGFYDYFGFNITYACRGAETTINEIIRKWQQIIVPFCGVNVPEGYETIEDVCPIPDPSNAPPEEARSVATTTTTTTERTWQFYEPKEGTCPTTTAPCDGVCGDDSHCGDAMKCCDQCCQAYIPAPATTTVTTTPATTTATSPATRRTSAADSTARTTTAQAATRTSRCPIRIGETKVCSSACADDSHCNGVLKCCDGCCKEPLTLRTGKPSLFDPSKSHSGANTSSGNRRRLSLQLLMLTMILSFLLCR